ncbi:MAG: hypothetical protein HKN44_12940 [Ilumatobacter sp.]|nr:hypothetical protein [Ilumatobacter sp.]
MTPPFLRSCSPARRRLGITATVIAAFTGALLAVGDPAAADQPALPINALAPQITATAEAAVVAYDVFDASDDLADYLVYAERRTATARLAARELGSDEWEMIEAWKSTPLDHQRAVLAAMTQVGVPYRTNASEEGEGFDCSGLTLFAWNESGVELNRVSGDQIAAAAELDGDEAKAGDLAYWPGHVMMYLGTGDAVVHARNTGRTVELETISARRADRMRFGDPTE